MSTNGGLNWRGNDTCTGQPINLHGGDPGIVIDKNGVFILYHVGPNLVGLYTHYSTDQGLTWLSAYPLVPSTTPVEDKGTMTTDNVPTSPFYGRTYASWVNYVTPYPVNISYTTSSGINWSSYSHINNPVKRCSGGDVKTGPNGQVYVAWAVTNDGMSNFPDTGVGFAASTNGGVNWSVSEDVYSMKGIAGPFAQKNGIFVNGIPRLCVDLSAGSRRGFLYIVTNEVNRSPAGSDPDIVFHRSTNGGQTWSQGIRVNQDPLNDGKIQLFPAICIDSTGAINVLYFDDRNTTSDSTDIFFSRSSDGGDTWHDYIVSDRRFKPQGVLPSGYQGDFIYMVSTRNKLFPVWMANYTGTYKAWMRIIDISTIGIQQINSRVPETYSLSQNYPNPFNPSTTIDFSVPKREVIKLIIYDILGKEITTLVNSELSPGTYKTVFEANNLSSGIYFYSLQTESFKETKRMVLVK